MSEKKIEVTIPEEPENKEPESKEPELQAEKAAEKATEASENKEESKEAAEQASQAAKQATEASEQAKKSTSYNEYALKGLLDSVTLVVTRMEQIMGIVKEMKEEFHEINEELRVTTEVHQEQIGQIDEATNKLMTATAALVKVHQQMNSTTE